MIALKLVSTYKIKQDKENQFTKKKRKYCTQLFCLLLSVWIYLLLKITVKSIEVITILGNIFQLFWSMQGSRALIEGEGKL